MLEKESAGRPTEGVLETSRKRVQLYIFIVGHLPLAVETIGSEKIQSISKCQKRSTQLSDKAKMNKTKLLICFALPQNPQSRYLSDYLITIYDKVSGSVDMGRAVEVIYLKVR